MDSIAAIDYEKIISYIRLSRTYDLEQENGDYSNDAPCLEASGIIEFINEHNPSLTDVSAGFSSLDIYQLKDYYEQISKMVNFKGTYYASSCELQDKCSNMNEYYLVVLIAYLANMENMFDNSIKYVQQLFSMNYHKILFEFYQQTGYNYLSEKFVMDILQKWFIDNYYIAGILMWEDPQTDSFMDTSPRKAIMEIIKMKIKF